MLENVDVFYVGTNGSFDRIAYHVLCQLENKCPIKINVVLAYLNNDKDSYYDYKNGFSKCVGKHPCKIRNHKTQQLYDRYF